MYRINENNKTLVDLVIKAKAGGEPEKMAVVNRMEALLRKSAKENDSWKMGCGIDQDDLYQAGCLGVLKAIEKYNPGYGKTFSTYAREWIQAQMSYLIYHNSATIRVPLLKARKYNQIAKDLEILNTDDLCSKHQITSEAISILTLDNPSTFSLHHQSSDDSCDFTSRNRQIEESIADPAGHTPFHVVDENERLGVFKECLGQLSPKERDVVESFYGLAGKKARGGLATLGKKYGCTSQNLYTIKAKAVRKLAEAVRERLGIETLDLVSDSDWF